MSNLSQNLQYDKFVTIFGSISSVCSSEGLPELNMNGKMKRNGVVAKLLFLESVYMNFPHYCKTIYLIIIIIIFNTDQDLYNPNYHQFPLF